VALSKCGFVASASSHSAGIEFDELAYETVPAYRDCFCGVIEECVHLEKDGIKPAM
jgi:hypothetical protein